MSVIPVDEPPSARTSSVPGSFWQRFAQALDAYLVDRTKRAVPEVTLRRCKHDVDRLRRLMHKNSLVPVGASLSQRRSGPATRQR